MFFADDSKTLVTVYAKHLKSAPKRSFWVLSKNGMVHRFWSYHLWDIEVRNTEKLLSQEKNNETLHLQVLISCWWLLRIQQSIAFSEKAKQHFSDASKYFVQTVNDFLLASAENTKMSHFWHFNDHHLGSKHNN